MSRCRFVVALCIIRVLLVSTSVSAEKPPIPPLPTPSPWDTLTSVGVYAPTEAAVTGWIILAVALIVLGVIGLVAHQMRFADK